MISRAIIECQKAGRLAAYIVARQPFQELGRTNDLVSLPKPIELSLKLTSEHRTNPTWNRRAVRPHIVIHHHNAWPMIARFAHAIAFSLRATACSACLGRSHSAAVAERSPGLPIATPSPPAARSRFAKTPAVSAARGRTVAVRRPKTESLARPPLDAPRAAAAPPPPAIAPIARAKAGAGKTRCARDPASAVAPPDQVPLLPPPAALPARSTGSPHTRASSRIITAFHQGAARAGILAGPPEAARPGRAACLRRSRRRWHRAAA